MAMAILLAGVGADQPVVGPGAANALAELGITRVSLLRDSDDFSVVLEGWAFDPANAGEAVRAVFPRDSDRVRVFREIEQVAVSTALRNGGLT